MSGSERSKEAKAKGKRYKSKNKKQVDTHHLLTIVTKVSTTTISTRLKMGIYRQPP